MQRDLTQPQDSIQSIHTIRKIALQPHIDRYVSEALTILEERLQRKLFVHKAFACHRMTVSLGNSRWIFYEHLGEGLEGRYEYELKVSTHFFSKDSIHLKETVWHEVCHLVDHQCFGNWQHSNTWEFLMGVLGLEPIEFCSEDVLEEIIADCVDESRVSPYNQDNSETSNDFSVQS